jgi:hypothetical protein
MLFGPTLSLGTEAKAPYGNERGGQFGSRVRQKK